VQKGQGLTLYKVDNGWVVQYGCVTLVFEDLPKLQAEMVRFLSAPDKVISEYARKYAAPYPAPSTSTEAEARVRDGRDWPVGGGGGIRAIYGGIGGPVEPYSETKQSER